MSSLGWTWSIIREFGSTFEVGVETFEFLKEPEFRISRTFCQSFLTFLQDVDKITWNCTNLVVQLFEKVGLGSFLQKLKIPRWSATLSHKIYRKTAKNFVFYDEDQLLRDQSNILKYSFSVKFLKLSVLQRSLNNIRLSSILYQLQSDYGILGLNKAKGRAIYRIRKGC